MMSGYGLMMLLAATFGGAAEDGGGLAPAGGQTKTFGIAISGSAGVKVVAACIVDWGDDVDVVTLKGEVPQTRKVEAVGIACQIKKLGNSGRLLVEISKNGRVVS